MTVRELTWGFGAPAAVTRHVPTARGTIAGVEIPLKVRIGVGLGTDGPHGSADRWSSIVDRCEILGFDSIWLSERIASPAPDPLIALAVAAGRTERLKLGTAVLVVPGRNPVVLAQEMASLDVLSRGRFLPAVGLGAVNAAEQQAFGVRREDRGRRFDEALTLMRQCWTGTPVTHHGEFYDVDQALVLPVPSQESLDVWLGGIAPSELRRVGRMGDGWLPSFCSPADIAEGRHVIEQTATAAGRSIDPQHFGALVAYTDRDVPERLVKVVERRRPGLDPRAVIPTRDGLAAQIREFVDAGATKFVVMPLASENDLEYELAWLADELLPLEN